MANTASKLANAARNFSSPNNKVNTNSSDNNLTTNPRQQEEMTTGSARGSPVLDSDDIFMSTGDEIETSILMEADTVRIEQHQNGQSIPVGPSTAVDLIVASAARAAADAALADSVRKVPPVDAKEDTNDGGDKKTESVPPTNLFPTGARESRRKRVAAKSVLSNTPSNSVHSIPRQSTVLYEFEAYESNKNEAVSPFKKGGSKATRSSPSKAKGSKAKTASKKTVDNKKAKTKVVPKKASQPAAKHSLNGSVAAKEVWSGVPTEEFEFSWNGWTKKTFERQSGKTKGTKDSYWYTPQNQYKLRSLVEVRRYCELLKKHKTEEKAWVEFKKK